MPVAKPLIVKSNVKNFDGTKVFNVPDTEALTLVVAEVDFGPEPVGFTICAYDQDLMPGFGAPFVPLPDGSFVSVETEFGSRGGVASSEVLGLLAGYYRSYIGSYVRVRMLLNNGTGAAMIRQLGCVVAKGLYTPQDVEQGIQTEAVAAGALGTPIALPPFTRQIKVTGGGPFNVELTNVAAALQVPAILAVNDSGWISSRGQRCTMIQVRNTGAVGSDFATWIRT